MHCQHLVSTFAAGFDPSAASLVSSRRCAPWLAHLKGMDTNLAAGTTDTDPHQASLEAVLTLSELAALLCVSAQTLYDLRSQGRGPRGFRVGRELRFRVSEVHTWLARMEQADAERHPAGGR